MKPKSHPMMLVLKNRNLRLLWIGEALSVLGSQFHLIALPWLVLQITGDPFQMGTVLALAGIPRALFMLVGGAFTDRFSPRKIMIASNAVRMCIGVLLAMMVLYGLVDMRVLYVLSLTFGLADAFLFPAQSAIMPKIVQADFLLAGNSIVQGTAQLSIAVGPALAGFIIALFSGNGESVGPDKEGAKLVGIAIAFAVNATAFLLSILFFSLLRLHKSEDAQEAIDGKGVFTLLQEGLSYIKSDRTLLYLLLVAGLNHFLVEGPLFIGIPVLANSLLTQGAAAFGIIMSGLGAGMLVGIVAAGALPALKPKSMGQILISLLSLSGFGLMAIGFISDTYLMALVVMLMGMAQGYVIVQYSTWMQIRTPPRLLGRTLSMMMFASIGLVPVSQALCGALIKLSVTGLFVGAGLVITLVNLIMTFQPEIKKMGLSATIKSNER